MPGTRRAGLKDRNRLPTHGEYRKIYGLRAIRCDRAQETQQDVWWSRTPIGVAKSLRTQATREPNNSVGTLERNVYSNKWYHLDPPGKGKAPDQG